MQSSRDVIDILGIEKISIFGLLIGIIIALILYIRALQKNLKEARDNAVLVTARYEEKIEEMNNKMMAELRNSANAYKEQSETLRLILNSQRKNE